MKIIKEIRYIGHPSGTKCLTIFLVLLTKFIIKNIFQNNHPIPTQKIGREEKEKIKENKLKKLIIKINKNKEINPNKNLFSFKTNILPNSLIIKNLILIIRELILKNFKENRIKNTNNLKNKYNFII
jgi:hypothetical protein